MTRPIQLMLVDDDAGMRKTLARILDAKGFDVRLASSGEEAVALAEAEAPDGLLMDIKMPGIDGVEAFRRIRKLCPNAFVVFMTAYSLLAGEAQEEGAVAVLGKPLDPQKLCSLLESAASTRPVLVVDDDPVFLSSLERVLCGRGFDVRVASSPERALSILQKEPRCIALLDMKLNGRTGLDVLRAARERNASACGILMTGLSEMEPLMTEGAGLGAETCFTKPLDIEGLLRALEVTIQAQVMR